MAEQDWKELYKQQQQKRGSTKNAKRRQTMSTMDELAAPAQTVPKVRKTSTSSAPDTLVAFRKIIIAIWIGITSIQIVIWLLIGIFGQHFPDPWWLWTGVSGGVVVAVIWYVSAELQNRKNKRGR